jgi:hypothetical protein
VTCPRCGIAGIHACPGEPIPDWTPEKVRELRAVLRRYEAPASRRQREGWYVGAVRGRYVRRRALLPALMIGDTELFPPSVPMVDSGIAWLTLVERGVTMTPMPRRFRYRTKTMECEVRVEVADD